MEDNDYVTNDYEDNEIDEDREKELPKSPINKYTYSQLLKISKEYSKQLTKTIDTLVLNRKKLILSKNDMQALNNLLIENYKYLQLLVPKTIYSLEFNNLYSISLSILSDLSQIELEKIKVYQKLQKLKFMELKFQNLRLNGTRNDFIKADNLLEEIENIQKEKSMASKISLVGASSILLYKAMVKFYLEDIELAEEYALQALNNLERNKDVENEGNKKVETISNILEFLIEIYDLKKDYNSVMSCYDKAYYINLGKYGSTSSKAQKYKKIKENYQNYIKSKINFNNDNYMNQNYNDNNQDFYYNNFNNNSNFNNEQLMQGIVTNAKGTTDTFSFKIPITKNIEPMIISIYALAEDFEEDRFSPELFLKNIYLDKNMLFNFYGLNEHSDQQNNFLYSDDTINDLLDKVYLEDNSTIVIENSLVKSAIINC